MSSDDLGFLARHAHALLSRALSAEGCLVDWTATQVDHRPGVATTAVYRIRLQGAAGVRSQTACLRLAGAAARIPPELAGVPRLDEAGRTIHCWAYPDDPFLPGLAQAVSPAALGPALRGLGLTRSPDRCLTATLRGWRPGRRAVVEIHAQDAHLFCKVVRPARAEPLHTRHALLARAGLPVPAPLGWTPSGLVWTAPLPGRPLRELVSQPGARLPAPDVLASLLDRFPATLPGTGRRDSWSDGAAWYAGILADALPAEAGRARQIAQAIRARTAGQPDERIVHGDFYEAQLLVAHGQVAGLLDLDTVGPGRRADDLACLVAHLEVLGLMAPPGPAQTLTGLAGSYARHFAGLVDPAELAARTAGVMLSLATGPHRVQERGWELATRRRLDAAERWLEHPPW